MKVDSRYDASQGKSGATTATIAYRLLFTRCSQLVSFS